MLRGLDSRGTSGTDESTIIKVAERESFDGDITVYVNESVSGDARTRQRSVIDELDRLQAAGVLDDTSVIAWQDADVVSYFEEFTDVVGEGDLEPFFEEFADGNAFDLPDVCIAVREVGELTGLYPRTKNGDTQTVEDGLRALCGGDRVENVDRTA
ncbi:MAG: hypothetical protein ACI8UR_001577 [Natronomonas sp.]|jgi:hypothetical protein|uniref:HTH domain-containing protein n=1 Tax=Natronomonas sp. TaxID=2184060 RepID=UPI0039E3776A